MKYFFLLSTWALLSYVPLWAQTKSNKGFCYTEATAKKATAPNVQAMTTMSSLNCPKYVVRVYFHFVKMNGNPGYSSSDVSTLMGHLNNTFNGYGISFIHAGDRDWYSDTWANTNTPDQSFEYGVFNDPASNPQPNAINLYILPKNVKATGGKGLINQNKLWVAGTRIVKFNCIYTPYEVPLTRVVAHEMGHCLGLQHTNDVADGDGDNLSDTPLDYSDKEECVDPSDCHFAGVQSGGCNYPCTLSSNPQTPVINNVMSGATLPSCMSQLSQMQVDIMKNNLAGSMNYVVENSLTVTAPPDIQNMYYNTVGSTQPPTFVTTYNSVAANTWWRIQTNINASTLSGPISWNPNTWVNAFANGPNNIEYYLNLSSGQSTNIAVSATNACGTSNRTIAFATYYGYRMYPNPAKTTVYVEFDNTEKAELLPEEIRLFSEKSTNPIQRINVQEAHRQKAFKNGNQLELEVKSLPRGTYYLHIINSKRKDLETDIIRLLLE